MSRIDKLQEARGKLSLLASVLDEIRADPEAYAILEVAIMEQWRVEQELQAKGLSSGLGTEALLHFALVAHAHCLAQIAIEADVEKALKRESSLFLQLVRS